jgi:hypothetical protein
VNHGVYLLRRAPGARGEARPGKSVETRRIIRHSPSVPDDDENVEESPEQVLARLVRYRDSLHQAPRGSWGGEVATGTGLVPAPARVRRGVGPARGYWTHSSVPATLVGQLLAVVACALAVRAFEQFDRTTAIEVVGGTAFVGLVAAMRRVPLALWLTLGVVVGGVLGRWS